MRYSAGSQPLNTERDDIIMRMDKGTAAGPRADGLVMRAARLEDLAAIIALLADDELGSARETKAQGGSVEPCYIEAFDAVARDANQLQLVAEIDGDIVGCLQLTIIPGIAQRGARRAMVEAVRIRSDLRGRRLGERMMVWAIDEARRRGCRTVQLTSNKVRLDAHRFYRRLGFVDSHVGMKLAL